MANKVGGIYGEVGLDISQATKNIRQLKSEVKGLEKLNKTLNAPSVTSYESAFKKLDAMSSKVANNLKKNNAALVEANNIIANSTGNYSDKEIRAAKERIRYNNNEIENKKQLLKVITDVKKGLTSGQDTLPYEDAVNQLDKMTAARREVLKAQELELANAKKLKAETDKKVKQDAQAAKIALEKARAVEQAAKAQEKASKAMKEEKTPTAGKQDIIDAKQVSNAKAAANAVKEIKKEALSTPKIDMDIQQSDIDYLNKMFNSMLNTEQAAKKVNSEIDEMNAKKMDIKIDALAVNEMKSISREFKEMIEGMDNWDPNHLSSNLKQFKSDLDMLDMAIREVSEFEPNVIKTEDYTNMMNLRREAVALGSTFKELEAKESAYAAKQEAYNKNKKLEVTFKKARAAARNFSEELKDVEGPDMERMGKLNYSADEIKAMTKDGDILRNEMERLQKAFGGANYALKHLKTTGQEFSSDASKMSTYIDHLRMKLESLKRVETQDLMRTFTDSDLMKPIGELETLDQKGERLYNTLHKVDGAADSMKKELLGMKEIFHIFDTLSEGLGTLEQANPLYGITKEMQSLEMQTIRNTNAMDKFKDASEILGRYNKLMTMKQDDNMQKPADFNKQFTQASADIDALIDRYVNLRRTILETQAVNLGNKNEMKLDVEALDLENSLRASVGSTKELEDALRRVGLIANMDTNLDTELRAASNEADNLEKDISDATRTATKLNTTFNRFFSNMRKGMSNAASSFNKLNSTSRTTSSNVSRVANETARVDKEAKNSLLSFKNISRVVSGIVISQGFYRALNQVERVIGAMAKTQALTENMSVSFGVMLRDFNAAEDFIQDLRGFAAVTPFSFEEAAKNAKMLKAYGFEAQQVIPIMEKLGDASAAIAEPETFTRITRALGQINTKGRLMQEEVRQLTEAGINMASILTEELGLTADQLQKIGKLGIPAEAAIGATLKGIQKQFGGSAEYLSRTMTGMWSTLRDNALYMASEMFQGVFDVSKMAMRSMLDSVEAASKTILEVGVGGWLEKSFSPEVVGLIRNYIAGLIRLGEALYSLWTAIQPLVFEFLQFAMMIHNIVSPAASLLIEALAWLIRLATSCAPLVRFLAVSIGSLAISMMVSKMITLLVGAIKKLAYSQFVAKAILFLRNAIASLAMFLNAHPIGWILLALGLAMGGLVASSDKLGSALNRLGNSFNKLGGIDPDKLLVPKEAKKEVDSTKKSYDETGKSANKAGKETDKLGDKAKKAAKKAKDAAASFDELFQLTQLDENKDANIKPEFDASAFEGGLDDVLSGLGDVSVPIGLDPTLPDDFDLSSDMDLAGFAKEAASAIGEVVMAVVEATGIKWVVENIADSIWKLIQITERSIKLVGDVMKLTGKALEATGSVIFTTTTLVVSELGLMFSKYGEIISKGVNDIVDSWTRNITPWFDQSLEQFNGWITESVLAFGRWGADSILQFGSWALDSAGLFAGWCVDTLGGFFDWTGDTGSALWTWVQDTWGIFSDWDNWTWENFSTWWSDTWEGFKGWASDTGDRLYTWFDDTTGGFLTWASDTWTGLSDWWSDTWSGWSTWWSDTKQGFSDWWSNTKEAWGNWGSDVYNIMSNTWSDLKQATSESMSRIGEYISTGWAEIKRIWSNWGEQVGQLWDWFWEDVDRIAGQWWEDIKGALWSWVESMIKPFRWLSDTIGKIFGKVKEDTDKATKDAEKAAKKIAETNASAPAKESGHSARSLLEVSNSFKPVAIDTASFANIAAAARQVPSTRQVLNSATYYYNSSNSNVTNNSTNGQSLDVEALAFAIANAVGNDDKPILQVGNLIATERGLKELEERLAIIRRSV